MLIQHVLGKQTDAKKGSKLNGNLANIHFMLY